MPWLCKADLPKGRFTFQENLLSPYRPSDFPISLLTALSIIVGVIWPFLKSEGVGGGHPILYFPGKGWNISPPEHSLCGNWWLGPELPGVSGQLSGAQPTAGPQSCILIWQMKSRCCGERAGGYADSLPWRLYNLANRNFVYFISDTQNVKISTQ